MAESIKIIGTKPRLLIIRYLEGREMGFNQLKRECSLSSRTLALNLKFLLRKGIVSAREEKNRRFYTLTKKGREMVPILHEIGRWGEKWDIWKAGRA